MSKLKRKYLKNEEMLKIENLNHEVKAIDYQIALSRNKIEILNYQAEKIQVKISELMRNKSAKIDISKGYSHDLKKLCGIKEDKWGYDPESGEIKL